jgi:hypothetical protein
MNGMYVVTGVVFTFPIALLVAAWRSGIKLGQGSVQPPWRKYFFNAALTVAGCATLSGIAFFISWFHNGGSPHGMDPSPGLWEQLGPIFKWTVIVSVVMGTLGKGKARFLVFGWAAAVVCSMALVFMLEMD